jgi:hypothetical protein
MGPTRQYQQERNKIEKMVAFGQIGDRTRVSPDQKRMQPLQYDAVLV